MSEFLDIMSSRNEVCINAFRCGTIFPIENLLNPTKFTAFQNARDFVEREHHYVKIAQNI